MANLRELLYIASSGLFIYGLYGLTGPTTAVRGNRIAAVGMAVAIVATSCARTWRTGSSSCSASPWAPRSACPPRAWSR